MDVKSHDILFDLAESYEALAILMAGSQQHGQDQCGRPALVLLQTLNLQFRFALDLLEVTELLP